MEPMKPVCPFIKLDLENFKKKKKKKHNPTGLKVMFFYYHCVHLMRPYSLLELASPVLLFCQGIPKVSA